MSELPNFPPPSLDEADPIITLAGRLHVGNPIRRAALQVIRGESLPSTRPLMEALLNPSVRRWRERTVAAWALSHAVQGTSESDSAASTLMDVLECAHKEGLWARILRTLTRDAVIGIAAGLILATIEVISRDAASAPAWPALVIMYGVSAAVVALPLTAPASFWFDRTCDDAVRATAAEALRRLGVADSVGTLAGRLFDRDARVRQASAFALHSLLPLLTTEHFGLFGAESMAHLGRALRHADTQLVNKVLAGLHHVGTSHALPWVKRFAVEGRTTRLRDSAKDLVDVLEARRARELNAERLLRPAAAGDAQAILLRPVRETESESAFLVRPVE